MTYHCSIYDSIADVDAGEWDGLCRRDDLLMDRRFIGVVERTMSDVARFRHLVFRDDDRRPVAIACLYCYRLNTTYLLSGRLKKVAQFFKRFLPSLFRVELLICGLPVPSGQNSLRVAPDADVAAVVQLLDEVMCSIAAREGISRMLIREFEAGEDPLQKALASAGYEQSPMPPMNHARGGYQDFDHFLAEAKSRKRSVINRSRKKFSAAGMRVSHIAGGKEAERRYTDDVHQLLEAVADGKPTLELMPADFFRELALQMQDVARFTFIEHDGRVVAFGASLSRGEVFHQLFVGFDYELNPRCDLYFNLFFNLVDDAFKQGAADIVLGQTSDTFKAQKLSAYQVPHVIYAKKLTRRERRRQSSDRVVSSSAAEGRTLPVRSVEKSAATAVGSRMV